MEYDPRYPQPFTLTQAIALDPEVARDEIARLRNSLLHLKRSQAELQECLRDLGPEGDLEVSQAIEENEITIASQDERIFMLKLGLTHHGHSVTLDQAPEPPTHSSYVPRGTIDHSVGSDSVGLDDTVPVEHPSAVNLETTEAVEPENGVYL